MRVRSLEQSTERYARNSARAFLEGERSIAWVTGVLRRSGLSKDATVTVLSPLRGYGDPERAGALFKWLDDNDW
jgi:hypothetical protein